jgi:spore germination cell wall hydrolase CwlJ-like protein
MAFLSVTGFCMLMSAAIWFGFIVNGRHHVPLSLPNASASLLRHDGIDSMELDCMARNVFFEARGESAKGKLMVASVVIQRTLSPHYPGTVCGVVTQANTDDFGRIIKNECSFSWMCDGQNHDIDLSNETIRREWMESYTISKLVMMGKLKPTIDMEGVTHYHADYVKPYWAKSKNYKVVAKVGEHIFYRWSKATLPKLTIASI